MASKQRPYTISIHSYKGGVGKSITAVNMAVRLAMQGKRVVLLDMDFGAPSLYTYFPSQMVEQTKKLNDVILRNVGLEEALFEANSLIPNLQGDLLVGLANHQSEETRLMVRRGIQEASQDAQKIFQWVHKLGKNPYNIDIILLDTAPGLNFLSVNSVSACDMSILLIRLLNADLIGTREMIQGLHSKLASEIFLLVNQLPAEYMEEPNAQEIEELIGKYIINRVGQVTPIFGGVIANDISLVKLEAENMLQLLRTGKEQRDIYVLKNSHGAFSLSINSVLRKLEEIIF